MPVVPDLNQRPWLPQVTMVAVTGVAHTATAAAMRRSMAHVRFGKALLLSETEPPGCEAAGIEWRQTRSLRSRGDYSRFILGELADQIATDHVLIVQWDGFVRDGGRWRPEFLDFDYIGAVWPQYANEYKVGNGGFSLRSRRLLQATRDLPPSDDPEDVMICRRHRRWLEEHHGIRFAPESVANSFAFERGNSINAEFGFHGAFNLAQELSDKALVALFESLEPGVVGKRESTELLTWAVRHRHVEMLRLAWRQHRAHPKQLRRLLQCLIWLGRGLTGAPGIARVTENTP